MPGFAIDLGHGDPGVAYSVLLAADAAGALLAGIALEAWGRLRATPRTAIVLAILWALSLLAFASVGVYSLAIALLFAAGFFELSFNTMTQTLVQLNAPAEIRGRVVGLFNMAGFGDWPNIPQPYEIVACLEQLSFSATDNRLIGADTLGLLQGLQQSFNCNALDFQVLAQPAAIALLGADGHRHLLHFTLDSAAALRRLLLQLRQALGFHLRPVQLLLHAADVGIFPR